LRLVAVGILKAFKIGALHYQPCIPIAIVMSGKTKFAPESFWDGLAKIELKKMCGGEKIKNIGLVPKAFGIGLLAVRL